MTQVAAPTPKAKVLLVEDIKPVTDLWGVYLDAAGIPYDVARSAPEAIQKLKNDPAIAYVALDYQLEARTTGDDVMRHIRLDCWNLIWGEHFPVVVTVSGDPYEPAGVTTAFGKIKFSEYLATDFGINHIKAYLRRFEKSRHMACHRPDDSAAAPPSQGPADPAPRA